MQPLYSDKEVLADALTAQKTTTGLFNTFSNECVHEEVRNELLHILEQEHSIQNDVFEMMHSKGYYPTPEAQKQKVDEAKQKFQQSVKMI
ncbi:MAG: spore coat protein [Hespellia sp.]|nr:spore coat protein [Hespellia sp.]